MFAPKLRVYNISATFYFISLYFVARIARTLSLFFVINMKDELSEGKNAQPPYSYLILR